MFRSLSGMKLSFLRVDAVRPDSLCVQDDGYKVLINQGMCSEEICCSLSHLQCWISFIDSEDELCVILEDDVHLSADFSAVLHSLSSQYTEFGERLVVVKLETFYATVTAGLKKYRLSYKRFASELLSNHGGSAGYVINRETAKYLINQFSGFCRAIDTELFHPDQRFSKDLVVYQVFPACVLQDHKKPHPIFESNIPSRLSLPKKRKGFYKNIKYLVTPLYLIACNLYLLHR